MPTTAIATYAGDATERVMESTRAAAAVPAQETVRGTEISAHMTVAVTVGNAMNAADGVKAAAISHYLYATWRMSCSSGKGGREDEHRNIGPSRRVRNGSFLAFRTCSPHYQKYPLHRLAYPEAPGRARRAGISMHNRYC